MEMSSSFSEILDHSSKRTPSLGTVSLCAIDDSGNRVDEIPSGLMAIGKAFESVSPYQPNAETVVHIVYGPCWDAVRAFLRRASFKRAKSILFLSDEVPTLVDVFDLWTLGPDDVGVWMKAYNSLRIEDLVRDMTRGHQLDDPGWFFSFHREEPEHEGEEENCAPEELFGSLGWEGLSSEFRACFRLQCFISGEQRVACSEPLSEAQWMSFFAGFCGSVFLGILIALFEAGRTSLVKSLLLLDSIKDRMPSWPARGSVMLSQICGKLDEWGLAEHCVSLAYDRSPGLKDGLVRLGWLKEGERDWEGALEYGKRDEQLGRLSSGWKVTLAQWYGRVGEFGKAEALIEEGYHSDTKLRDGFARLGWLKGEEKDWEGALEYGKRDEQLGRLSGGWKVTLAQWYGRVGEFGKAEALAIVVERDSLVDEKIRYVARGMAVCMRQRMAFTKDHESGAEFKTAMGFDLRHLMQERNQAVVGPVQDDEALFLYGLVRCIRARRVLEVGSLFGYSTMNFSKAVGREGTVYTVDLDNVWRVGDNHHVLRKDAADVSGNDLSNQPVDLVFFDAHSVDCQMALFRNMVSAGIIIDTTYLAFHDTGLHPFQVTKSATKTPNGWIHQHAEREMVRQLLLEGYSAISFGVNNNNYDSDVPFRHPPMSGKLSPELKKT